MIKVSVIVPIYNSAKYLEKCIESLINQTLKDIEIILIDGGSTDGSIKIIESYLKKDKRLIFLKENLKNQASARNLGLKQAKGEYISFIDSDDWVESDFLKKLYDNAKKNNSDISFCSFIYFDEFKKRYKEQFNYRDFPKIEKDSFFVKDEPTFFFEAQTSVCNKLIKADFLNYHKFLFDENLYFEDFIFLSKIWIKEAKISFIKEYKYFYRIESENSTYYKNDKAKLDLVNALELAKKYLIKNGVYENIQKEFDSYKIKTIFHGVRLIKNFWFRILYIIKLLFK